MQNYELISGGKGKLPISEYKRLKAAAYASGTLHMTFIPKYVFEDEYYKKGEFEDLRLRDEIKSGQR